MKREVVTTADGSSTISVPDLNEHYHSVNGAIAEAKHIYIDAGFKVIDKDHISVLEIGLGTGLNALLSLLESIHNNKIVFYHAVEAYPISLVELSALNYIDEHADQE